LESEWNEGPGKYGLVGVTRGLCARLVAYPDGTPFEFPDFIMTNGKMQDVGIDVWALPSPDLGDEYFLLPGFSAVTQNFPYGWGVDPPAPQPP
jgi:hypothetical protein